MNQLDPALQNCAVTVLNATGASPVVVVCEHASRFIPPVFDNLGLQGDALTSHAAWDPGAMAVSEKLAELLDAPLVASGISRLVYDCNRPPEAADSMPAKSELFDIPGNVNLTSADRNDRAAQYYHPFRKRLADVVAKKQQPILVTIHSFTPVYYGKQRAVEIGILHDTDTQLADAMLACAAKHTKHQVERNQPYGPDNGVTHTLQVHGIAHGHANVMIEVRNDLIATTETQSAMAKCLAGWIIDAAALQPQPETATCKA